jgi:hypothetical protein
MSTMLIYWYDLTTTHLECVIQDNYTDNEFCSAWFSSGGVDAKGFATDLGEFPNTSNTVRRWQLQFCNDRCPISFSMGLNMSNHSFSTNSQTQNRKGSSSCKCVYNGYTLLHGWYLNYCIRPCVKEYSVVQMLLKKTWVGALVMMEWNFAWWSDRLSLQNKKPE